MAVHRLCIPRWHPPLANQWRGRHWSVAHRLRRAAAQLLGAYALQQRVPRATTRRKVSVLVTLGPRQRPCDTDAYDKLLLDGLVGAGLLVDDGAGGLAGRVEVTFSRGTASAWGTVVVLEDLQAGLTS